MPRWTRCVAATIARAAVFFLLWLVLVDNVKEPELITGAVVAFGAAALVIPLGGVRGGRALVRPSMLRYCYRPLLLLVVDSARVTWALIATLARRRPVEGRFRAVRYRATGMSGEDAARRVLTEWGASLGPNRYVVGVDRERGLLLVHELVRAHGPLDPLELG
jgi:multisubunit Na+/H+ antiporter MnhE subunit